MRTNTANIYKGREGVSRVVVFFFILTMDGKMRKRERKEKKNKTLIGKEKKKKNQNPRPAAKLETM